eukprot:CAMPEP_0202863612 /NCGR_PEP_ID=MMETSP1391-20130828/4181_1 /ASSEMBLY_ACC=CAM_ASM_000867 /TAXON_ID=1034604 /ORGANISM="Chlamydomonas leiostraca, Strain SAG 11-49" /LENGTH=35 /DNA_ID= /DNA_START= /DNA_END= /DNA_ORIENTATION=
MTPNVPEGPASASFLSCREHKDCTRITQGPDTWAL